MYSILKILTTLPVNMFEIW